LQKIFYFFSFFIPRLKYFKLEQRLAKILKLKTIKGQLLGEKILVFSCGFLKFVFYGGENFV